MLSDQSICYQPTCNSTQDPNIDQCQADTGLTNALIYRLWSFHCPKIPEVELNEHRYIWELKDSFGWTNQVSLRCSFGYVIPESNASVRIH